MNDWYLIIYPIHGIYTMYIPYTWFKKVYTMYMIYIMV